MFLGPLFSSFIEKVLVQRVQQERTKTAFRAIRTFNQSTIEHDLVEKTLCQVFGLLIIVAFAMQIAVNRLPIPFQQQSDESAVFVLMLLDIFKIRDQWVVRNVPFFPPILV